MTEQKQWFYWDEWVSKPIQERCDNPTYVMSAHCQNCGQSNKIYILKGVPKNGITIKCTNCGCEVVL